MHLLSIPSFPFGDSYLSLKSNVLILTATKSGMGDIYLQAEYETLVSGTMAAASKTHRVGLILCGTGRLWS